MTKAEVFVTVGAATVPLLTELEGILRALDECRYTAKVLDPDLSAVSSRLQRLINDVLGSSSGAEE